MSVTVGSAGQTSVGRVRTLNEDAWYAGEHLFVVADGMGGHAAGDVASALTIAALTVLDRPGVHAGEVAVAIAEANAAVLAHAVDHPEATGLGSTVCGLVAGNEGWLVFNVGDSRCYEVAEGRLRQITVDHSEVQELIDAGQLTREEARVHPNRNVITRAVGQDPGPEVDFFVTPAGVGSRLLLSSDGLSTELDDAQIAQCCATTTVPAELAALLVRVAEDAGGRDNITVIVVDDVVVDDDTRPRRRSTTVPRDLIVREVAQ